MFLRLAFRSIGGHLCCCFLNVNRFFWIIIFTCILHSEWVSAQYEVYPDGFNQVLVASGLSYPTAVAFAPDGRIFVAEQAGQLRVIKNGVLLATPFVILNDVYAGGEAGLTGVVLDPDFELNQYIYLYYTIPGKPYPYFNRIVHFKANGDVALAGSEKVILDLDPLSFAEQHNGGAMKFGVDGKLYIGVGDSRNSDNAQDLDTYLGKILRINPDGSAPSDNPFLTGSEQRKRIWAYGLRNPYTFSVQPISGRTFVNDVGEGSWEEINDATIGGRNFGWPQAEGISDDSLYTNPVFAYDHNNAQCALTGGEFFNPLTTSYPASYISKYFYQDLCTSTIKYLDLSSGVLSSTIFAQNLPGQPVGLTVGLDGNLYFLSRQNSSLYKIIYTTNSQPEIITHPSNSTVSQGRAIKFSVFSTGSAPLSFQWQKNQEDIEGATAATYVINNSVSADSGSYRVIVSNPLGTTISNEAKLTVTIPNALPTVKIKTPVTKTVYKGGDVINFSGMALDVEDDTLPAESFVWTVLFHHNTHYHDGPPIAVGVKSGQFTIPNQGETASDVFYRLILTVTDSQGGVSKDTVDLIPHIVTVSLMTNRAGLQLSLNGPPVSTPFMQSFVTGIKMTLAAPTSQTVNGVSYIFKNWIKGPDSTGYITVPDTNTVFKASYIMSPCVNLGNFKTTSLTDVSAKINWQIIGATEDMQYQIRWRQVGVVPWMSIDSLTTGGETGVFSLTGLAANTQYEWQIKALCSSVDSSAFSSSVIFKTLGSCRTLKDGSWSDVSIWSCGHIPTVTDVVNVKHEVVVPKDYTANAAQIMYDLPAKLIWSSRAKLLLSQ